MRIEYARVAGRDIAVTCTARVSAADPGVHWRLAARFADTLTLEEVQFPFVVVAAPLHAGAAGEAVVMGNTKGGVSPRPSEWKPTTRLAARQPGSLAAAFIAYCDATGGLTLAAHDGQGYPKTAEVRRVAEGLELDFDHHCFATPALALDYDTVLTPFRSPDPARPTDWRDGADVYKAWAVTQPWCAHPLAERSDLPAWLKSGAAMVRFGRGWLANPDLVDEWLKTYWRRHFPADVPLIIAYWGWEKVDTWVTPDYFPAFPSDEQFTALTARTRKLGGHTFLWPSGYHYTITYKRRADGTFEWDDRARFDATARPHAVQGRDGKLLLRPCGWLRGGENATLCPGDPWTIDWFNQLSGAMVARGAELVQVDQVVGGAFPACYSTTHGHPPGPGLWMTQAFHRQLETMARVCRERDPASVVCFEEPNEWFLQHVGMQDYRDWEVLGRTYPPVEPASVFNYVYHEYVPTFQSNPHHGDRLMSAYCLVNGQVPHLVPMQHVGPGSLVLNSDFERWSGQVPLGWDKVGEYRGEAWRGECFCDETEKHGGTASLRLENRAPDDIVQVSQNVPVGGQFAVGGTYRLSVWIKTAGLTRANGIALGTFTGDMQHTGGAGIALPHPATDGWVRGEATFGVPAGSQLLRIMLHLSGPGRAWIDDMTVERLDPAGTATALLRPEVPPDHPLMRRWVELYAGEGRPYLLLGTMLHPPPLEVATFSLRGRQWPALLHNAFRAADGSEAVVIVNPTDTPQSGTLRWEGKTVSLMLAPDEVRLLKAQGAGG